MASGSRQRPETSTQTPATVGHEPWTLRWPGAVDYGYQHGLLGQQSMEVILGDPIQKMNHHGHPVVAQNQDNCMAEQCIQGLGPYKLQAAAHQPGGLTQQGVLSF